MATDEERAKLYETIDQGKQLALALALSHIGDVNAMSNEQVKSTILRIQNDPALSVVVLNVLAGVSAAFATGQAARTHERGSTEWADASADVLRTMIEKFGYWVW